MSERSHTPIEVAVIGGGPAGLATAIACANQGMNTRLFDTRVPPIDKACGEGLMPSGIESLRELGIDTSQIAGREFVGIRYFGRDARGRESVLTGDFREGGGLGIRRTELHRVLTKHAENAGVDLQWGERVNGVDGHIVEHETGRTRAHFIVGADGLHSKVRTWAGFVSRKRRAKRFGVRRHFRVRPWSRYVDVHWADGMEAYVTPVGEDTVGIALLVSRGQPRFETVLTNFPQLVDRLGGPAESVSDERGAGPFAHDVDRVQKGQVLLVGDASGYVDPITGEGVGLALRQALALARCLREENPGSYPDFHSRLLKHHRRVTRGLLLAQKHPLLLRTFFSVSARHQRVFERALRWCVS